MVIRNPINHPSIIFKKDSIEKAGSYEDMKFLKIIFSGLNAKN